MLRKALHRLVHLAATKGATYFYMNDQFKAIRQDCTVQQIKNELAVQVGEGHQMWRGRLPWSGTATLTRVE